METHIWIDKENGLLRHGGKRPLKFGDRFDGAEFKGTEDHVAAGRAMKIEAYAEKLALDAIGTTKPNAATEARVAKKGG